MPPCASPPRRGFEVEFVRVVRDSPSDDVVQIVEIYVNTGEEVRENAVIADVEGSKSVFPLVTGESGILHWYVGVGEPVAVGAVVSVVLERGSRVPDRPTATLAKPGATEDGPAIAGRFSAKALERVNQAGLSAEFFLPEHAFVTLEDVEKELDPPDQSGPSPKPLLPTRIAFLGGGKGAQVLREISSAGATSYVVGVFDDSSNSIESFGVPLLGTLGDRDIVREFEKNLFDKVAITITGDMRIRRRLLDLCDTFGIPLHSFLDTAAFLSGSAEIGDGTVAVSGSRVGTSATLARNVFLSAYVNIDHHCVIGENTTFGPGVYLSGGVKVGADCVFGTNIGVEPGIEIGDRSVISSGTVVTKNIPAGTVVKNQSATQNRIIEQ